MELANTDAYDRGDNDRGMHMTGEYRWMMIKSMMTGLGGRVGICQEQGNDEEDNDDDRGSVGGIICVRSWAAGSGDAWGVFCQGVTSQDAVSVGQQDHHAQYLETLADGSPMIATPALANLHYGRQSWRGDQGAAQLRRPLSGLLEKGRSRGTGAHGSIH